MSRSVFKVKKFIASKFSEGQVGRTLLLKFFGQHGDLIVNTMKECAEKYENIEKAKQLKVDILKLIMKFVLLYKHGVITEQMSRPARSPLLAMLDLLISSLEAVKAKRNPQELSDAMMTVHNSVMPLIQPNVRDHNWKRLTRIFAFYGNVEFLTTFLKEDSYEPQRQSILDSFRNILQPYEVEMSELKQIMLRKDTATYNQYKRLATQPVINEWLAEERASTLFSEWLLQNAGSDGTNYLKFLKSVAYFKGTQNRSLLKNRSAQLYEQYISDTAPNRIVVVEDVLMEVKKRFLAQESGRSLFKRAEEKVLERLDELFSTGFVGSEQFNVVVEKYREIQERLEIHNGIEERNASQKLELENRETTIDDVVEDPDSHLVNMTLLKHEDVKDHEHQYDSEDDSHILAHEHGCNPEGAAEESRS